METLDTTQIAVRANNALTQANAVNIETNNDLLAAQAFRDAFRSIEKQINDTFDPLIDSAHKHHKALVAEKKKHAEPLEQARTVIKAKMISYEEAQERIRQEQEEKLRSEAQKLAEEQALAQAVEAERQGDKATAQAIIEAPVVAAPVVVQKMTPKVSGFTVQTRWDGVVTNLGLLIQAVAQKKAPANFLEANPIAIRQFATSTKGSIPVPGVAFSSRKV